MTASPFFSDIQDGEAHVEHLLPDGRTITVSLFAHDLRQTEPSEPTEEDLRKINAIAAQLNQAIARAHEQLVACCQVGAPHEETMTEYRDYVLFECGDHPRDQFASDFGKPYGAITPLDFAKQLHLRGVCFSPSFNEVVFDFLYEDGFDEVCAMHFDLDMNFVAMHLES